MEHNVADEVISNDVRRATLRRLLSSVRCSALLFFVESEPHHICLFVLLVFVFLQVRWWFRYYTLNIM